MQTVLTVLAIVAPVAFLAKACLRAGKLYDEDIALDYAKMRAQLDAQAERAAQGAE
jgi:hypothetical protein